eukprot:652331-Lingulodinium_polyedra.AAC.1
MAGTSSAAQHHDHPAVVRVHGLSKTSNCLSKEGAQALAVACEAAKEVMQEDFRGLLHEQRGRALLSSKSCDGTPMSV